MVRWRRWRDRGRRWAVGKAIGAMVAGGGTLGIGAVGGAAVGMLVDKAVSSAIVSKSEEFVKTMHDQYKDTPDDEPKTTHWQSFLI